MRVFLVLILLASGTGCREHKRLGAETALLQEKVRELKPQAQEASDEARFYSDALDSLRKHPANHQGANAMEVETKKLEQQLADLQSKKSAVSAELKNLQEEMSRYRESHVKPASTTPTPNPQK